MLQQKDKAWVHKKLIYNHGTVNILKILVLTNEFACLNDWDSVVRAYLHIYTAEKLEFSIDRLHKTQQTYKIKMSWSTGSAKAVCVFFFVFWKRKTRCIRETPYPWHHSQERVNTGVIWKYMTYRMFVPLPDLKFVGRNTDRLADRHEQKRYAPNQMGHKFYVYSWILSTVQ